MKFSSKQKGILRYILANVISDMEYDNECDDYRDCGGIIVCLERDEYEELLKIKKML